MKEVWRPVVGCEGLYEVSNLGRVRSVPKVGFSKQLILKQQDERHGYKRMRLTKENRKFCKLVHRMVAEAFIPNPSGKPCVNHINGNKTDNRVENLEWVTYSENYLHAVNHGLIDKGSIRKAVEASSRTRRSNCVRVMRSDGEIFESIAEAARSVGVDRAVLSRAVAHRRGKKTAGGYSWEYVER